MNPAISFISNNYNFIGFSHGINKHTAAVTVLHCSDIAILQSCVLLVYYGIVASFSGYHMVQIMVQNKLLNRPIIPFQHVDNVVDIDNSIF